MKLTTVESVLKDHPICHKNVVFQDMWSLVTGSVILKCRSCQKWVVCQDRWSLMAVVSQERFHCIHVAICGAKYSLLPVQWNGAVFQDRFHCTTLFNPLPKTKLLDHRWRRCNIIKHPLSCHAHAAVTDMCAWLVSTLRKADCLPSKYVQDHKTSNGERVNVQRKWRRIRRYKISQVTVGSSIHVQAISAAAGVIEQFTHTGIYHVYTTLLIYVSHVWTQAEHCLGGIVSKNKSTHSAIKSACNKNMQKHKSNEVDFNFSFLHPCNSTLLMTMQDAR